MKFDHNEEKNIIDVKDAKKWINDISDWLKGSKHLRDSKDWKERYRYIEKEVYVQNLKRYLLTGVYHDNKYGANREGAIVPVCVAMAYDKKGEVKRNVGTWYPDCGLWTKEMQMEKDNG